MKREIKKTVVVFTTGNFGTGSIVNQQYYLLEKLEEQALYTIQLKEEKDSEIQVLEARLQVLEAQQQQNKPK